MIGDPTSIAHCLCQQAAVTALWSQLQDARARYAAARDRADRLAAEASAARARLDINNPDAVDAYRRLVAAREQASAAFFHVETPAYAAAVGQYNARRDGFNADCAGHPYDPDALAAVQRRLVCPAPPPTAAPLSASP
jgi:hypothetical protein